jgi:CNT family concentrative nucleoside transporter
MRKEMAQFYTQPCFSYNYNIKYIMVGIDGMQYFSGLIGIACILGFAYLASNNKKAINWRLIISGLCLQWILALFILTVPAGQVLFQTVGQGIEKLLSFSDLGGGFVFGPLVSKTDKMVELFGPPGAFIFAFKLVPTIIFVATLVSIAYHIGLMQRVVQVVAWAVSKIMGASGAEALSNAASIFVGQVEAQLLIKPYVPTMTRSELLAIMSGSMACIAGGVMAVYIKMGVPAEYLLTASLMAAPGALVISKLVYPETEQSLTQGKVQVTVENQSVNIIDAAAHGAADGLKIGLNVCAMLIGFIALMGLIDFVIGKMGLALAATGLELNIGGITLENLTLKGILGTLFYWVALAVGVPVQDAQAVGSLMGTKMVINEFVAYADLTPMIQKGLLEEKSIAIASFALCGFANFSSIAMQIGGIGELAPTRKGDLAKLGLSALFCGTAASYVSSAIAGILIPLQGAEADQTSIAQWLPFAAIVGLIAVIILSNRLGSETSENQSASPRSLPPDEEMRQRDSKEANQDKPLSML